jgi:hypothetical protein
LVVHFLRDLIDQLSSLESFRYSEGTSDASLFAATRNVVGYIAINKGLMSNS